VGDILVNTFDYYKNETILKAISFELNRIKGGYDKEDCKQEIFAELYDFMPLDESTAVKIVSRVGRRYRRNAKTNYVSTCPNDDDYYNLGDGNYMRKAHYGSAD
jgi:hypothetical protein